MGSYWNERCNSLLIVNKIVFVPSLWRSGYLHDGRAEEILQCHEETRVKETTKTNTQASGNYFFAVLFPHQAGL